MFPPVFFYPYPTAINEEEMEDEAEEMEEEEEEEKKNNKRGDGERGSLGRGGRE